MDQPALYRVSVTYSTVPTSYDAQLGRKADIDWENFADPNRAPRQAHDDELEFTAEGPSEKPGENGLVEEPAVRAQLELQIREHLSRTCPEGYDLDCFQVWLADED